MRPTIGQRKGLLGLLLTLMLQRQIGGVAVGNDNAAKPRLTDAAD